MDITSTIEDSGAYTKPWTYGQPVTFLVDTELTEQVCNENNRDITAAITINAGHFPTTFAQETSNCLLLRSHVVSYTMSIFFAAAQQGSDVKPDALAAVSHLAKYYEKRFGAPASQCFNAAHKTTCKGASSRSGGGLFEHFS